MMTIMSAWMEINDLQDKKFEMIPVMIMNDYSKAGSAFWGNTQNKH